MRRALPILILIIAAAAAHGQNVVTRGPVPQLLIPAAGAQQGGGNTFFRSDITLINYRGADQRVRLQWLPEDTTGVGMAPVDITISAASGIASEDFVTNVMQKTGLGAILVTGIDAGGSPDPSALLVSTSRIWTPENGSSGTESQSLPSISTTDIASGIVSVLGSRRDVRYRMNVGIVSLATTTQTFQVTLGGSFGTQTQQVTVPAMAMTLFGVTGASSTTPLQIQVVNVGAPPRSSSWVTYASSVDNVTGDAWTTIGFNSGPPPP
ncbi:MAG TPA: hypothetical protein VN380_06730 [Thermoanaerobaculia bacterium]|jgi:hypothetical protein|nr:hypothetical protein [Thermoanaerobaculia bacterium]